ncbi:MULTISPECIES: hypothetical protein [unclassified Bacillus (in: firmicutes)]|uniref:hypothetical protein n=1 Tax=unclassified Bacillus (in: firmicutes) TaxID=185979 RepID=UPI00047AA382|nr:MULTISPECIES: hypothetical protein [unclassified Bacillus (in: firmicutes)]SDZ43443.1 hypothetical protein SAMN04488156_13812 [Bacillus sp. 166amftsu]
MGNFKKKNIIFSIIIAIIILAIGCTSLIIHNKNITKEKAAKVSIEHMKKEKNIDFVVTDVKIEHLEREGYITVSGYDKNNKPKKHYVVVNKIQNYEIAYSGEK